MKIGLQTWGTDGDFFPFLALAISLKEAGHEVTIAYTSIDGSDYSGRSDIDGIQLIKANGDIPIPRGVNPYAIKAKPGSFKEYSILLRTYFDPHTEAMYRASETLCQENDVVIGHAVCHTLLTASQKFSITRVSLVLTPLVVRSKYVSPIGFNLGPFINSFLWSIGGKVATFSWFGPAKKLRKREGLAPIKSLQKELFTSTKLTIVAASSVLSSRPKDWPETIQLSGFLNLPTNKVDWEMPSDLKAFLEAGEAPVYMTFGSCMQFDIQHSTELLIKAAKLSGKRAIIQSDWNELAKPNDPNLFCVDVLPHGAVFPHCSLVVHHGGAGTTQAALLAGKPSVVVAHGFDQVFWGNQLGNACVAGKTSMRDGLTAERLANEITVVAGAADKALIAEKIGAEMKKENGVQKAVALIESLMV